MIFTEPTRKLGRQIKKVYLAWVFSVKFVDGLNKVDFRVWAIFLQWVNLGPSPKNQSRRGASVT